MDENILTKIVVDVEPFDVTFYFKGSNDEPWSSVEFNEDSPTRLRLEKIINAIAEVLDEK